MALTCRAITRNCSFIVSTTKPVKWNFQNVIKNHPTRVLSSGICYKNNNFKIPFKEIKQVNLITVRQCASKGVGDEKTDKPLPETVEKKGFKGIIIKFKEMYRDYWYVLLPVHVATSLVWFGSFYYIVRSGIDVVGILESCGISESLLEPLKNSYAGFYALAFALYKLATPLRYAVTVGGTTYAIKRLTAIGWIKPVPSRKRIQEMLQEHKGNLQGKFNESKQHYQTKINESKQHYQTQMKEKRTQVMDEMKRYKTEMRNMKNKVKKM